MKQRLLSHGIINIADFMAIIIILFPICNLLEINAVSYYDECVGLFCVVYVFIHFLSGSFEKNEQSIIPLLFFVTVIGLLSNLINQVCTNFFAISVDVLWLWKTFATYIAFKHIASDSVVGEGIEWKLLPIAKMVVWLSVITAVLGQFVDIGVTGGTLLWNIKSFGFFWNNGIQTGWLLFCCILIISSIEEKKKVFYGYLILATIPLLLTGSSLVICWIFVEWFLLLILRNDGTVKRWHIIVLVGGVVGLVSTELVQYFTAGVRGTLLKKAFIVANRFFPLGSGFATYGSEMAQRYYSPLYSEFGWTNSWALGTDSSFLNDNFFACIIGQFGWIGFFLYILCLWFLFKSVNTSELGKNVRVTSIATVLTIVAVMVGSASAKSMMGVCTFAVLGIVAAKHCSIQNEGNCVDR